MTEPQRIIFYTQLGYQLLGVDADVQTYSEFISAFDAIAANCRERGQSFERVYPNVPEMLQWMSDNGHENNNKGRAAYASTLNAIHPDIDYIPKQTYAAANFASILGPDKSVGQQVQLRCLASYRSVPKVIMHDQIDNRRTTTDELRRNAIAALAMLLVISAGALIVSRFL